MQNYVARLYEYADLEVYKTLYKGFENIITDQINFFLTAQMLRFKLPRIIISVNNKILFNPLRVEKRDFLM